MTALRPLETWDVVGIPREDVLFPDLEVNLRCAVPGCDQPVDSGHHIWGRGKLKGEYDWVSIPELNLVLPNRIWLCGSGTTGHHGDVEDHRAWIRYEDGVFVWYERKTTEAGDTLPFEYRDGPTWIRVGLLDPQPGLQVAGVGRSSVGTESDPSDVQLTVTGEEVPHDQVVGETHDHEGVPEGSECPTCHRRVPHKKKKTSPLTKVNSYRGPIDEMAEHKEMLEAVSEHLGIGTKAPHWQYWTITAMGALVLQLPAEEVRVRENGHR